MINGIYGKKGKGMNSIVNRGNWKRLKESMLRARSGQRVSIGYIGGSITMGSLATTPEECYAYLSCQWWKDTFKNADILYHNVGIGATTSQFGAARVIEDLLTKSPDVIFVEFSVNDDNTEFFQETYEGLIRLIYQSNTKPAIILLHNAFFSDCLSSE